MRANTRSPKTELSFHPIVLTGIVVATIICFTAGYHWGVSDMKEHFLPTLSEQSQLRNSFAEKADACAAERKELINALSGDKHDLIPLHKDILAQKEELNGFDTEYQKVSALVERCEEQVDALKERIAGADPGDTAQRERIIEVETMNEGIRASIAAMTNGNGEYAINLAKSVNKYRNIYVEMCNSIPGCRVLSDDVLRAKWKSVYGRSENNSGTIFMYYEEKLRSIFHSDKYDLEKWNTSNLFLFSGRHGGYNVAEKPQPQFFNRSGDDIVVVNHAAPSYGVTSSFVARRMGDVLTSSMCAYHKHNANLTFQSAFTSPREQKVGDKESQPSMLHELVSTPLLSFHVGRSTNDIQIFYALNCDQYNAFNPHNYGTQEYWSVRSMTQASREIRTEGRQYWSSRELLELEGRRTLAVMINMFEQHQGCDGVGHHYGIHHTYLSARFPNDTSVTRHLTGGNIAIQCEPAPADLANAIKRLAADIHPVTVFLLLLSEDEESEVRKLLKEDPSIAVLPALQRSDDWARDEMLAVEIASWASDILVSPFLHTGRQITEAFLLRNNLKPENHVHFL